LCPENTIFAKKVQNNSKKFAQFKKKQ